jgi:L-histidine N-alpha-methyltransferase
VLTEDDTGLSFDPVFARHVSEGLNANPRFMRSRYFYDAEGDRLFQAIMSNPEYYLTDCEFEIFEQQGDALAAAIGHHDPIELVELGSGDGLKTELLIDALHRAGADLVFRPVDISANSLALLRERIAPGRPWLSIHGLHGDYEKVLTELPRAERRRVFMFLGSNLGNYTPDQAEWLLSLIRGAMTDGDLLLLGLDLKKDAALIAAAYNDAAGHTRRFNLNLLVRINRELGGHFDLDAFEHLPEYNPDTGAARSYLVSQGAQDVYITALKESFHFSAGERVFMEISQKYGESLIRRLSRNSGFSVRARFTDSRNYFTDQLWAPADHGPE